MDYLRQDLTAKVAERTDWSRRPDVGVTGTNGSQCLIAHTGIHQVAPMLKDRWEQSTERLMYHTCSIHARDFVFTDLGEPLASGCLDVDELGSLYCTPDCHRICMDAGCPFERLDPREEVIARSQNIPRPGVPLELVDRVLYYSAVSSLCFRIDSS